jgi:tRNA1(Val) A37 N6-methylase TrmN6
VAEPNSADHELASLGPLTDDRLLDGRVNLAQPVNGYRAAIDPVLLAAFVPARGGERVLELGAGAGAASLCLAARVPGVRVEGLEQDAATVALARANALRNAFQPTPLFHLGDLARPSDHGLFDHSLFDHAFANPPFLEAMAATAPADARRAAAHVEGAAGLGLWVASLVRSVRHRGTISLIHRADRLDGLLAAFDRQVGGIVILPLWPKAGRPAKRVLVRAVKGSRAALTLSAGLVLHQADGKFTAAAEAILRGGGSLTA